MNNSPTKLDSTISAYYCQTPEDDRLQQGAFLLEALRTRELIERHAPAAPATVFDIGGGAGAYAPWLSERGYAVHLLDPIDRHVAEAERRSAASSHPLASCHVGDARSLPFADETADVVLLLGPLYHLTSVEDRIQTLKQAARVLKPGGCLFCRRHLALEFSPRWPGTRPLHGSAVCCNRCAGFKQRPASQQLRTRRLLHHRLFP